MIDLEAIFDYICSGKQIDRETSHRLATLPDPKPLLKLADRLRRHFHGNRFSLCSIINVRSGNCSEDCRFCAQASRHHTGIKTYSLIDSQKALTIALDTDRHGVSRLSLVSSGRQANASLLDKLAHLYSMLGQETSLDFCASLGFLSAEKAVRLREMGVTRYHCNLETCREFFPEICSTHSYDDKVETLKQAQAAGLSRCSGGIIGLGESMEHRLELAFELHALGIRSIPINILTPIKETPLAQQRVLETEEVLTTVALFRIINPQAVIRIAGGRQQLGDEQYRCFISGANGAIVGNYLTTVGSSIAEDLRRIAALGYFL